MSIYLERYALAPLGLPTPPQKNTGLIVVIPIYNEPNPLLAVESLAKSELPPVATEVLLIINESEDCSTNIKKTNKNNFKVLKEWIDQQPNNQIKFYVGYVILPKKHAGVGMARKTGMDEAVRRFEAINNKKGIILCFDADCRCSTNYLKDVYTNFKQKKLHGASLYFEHPLKTASNKTAIIDYELHLRYYIQGLRLAGYPYAFHTVGSSMAVRADIYQKAGGMNKRKAGEDFHFLHKVIPYGNFKDISTATVYPSARISDRVPFGTGKAMHEWVTEKKKTYLTYHPQTFTDIKNMLKAVPLLYKCNEPLLRLQHISTPVSDFLKRENFENEVKEINRQSSTEQIFIHRFYAWLNGLRMLHLVHFLRDNAYATLPVHQAASQLINTKGTSEMLLQHYRKLDKGLQ